MLLPQGGIGITPAKVRRRRTEEGEDIKDA